MPTQTSAWESQMDPERLALRAHGLVKRLGHRTVVNGISLAVYPGQVVGLLGPNGAGKTTVFRMLIGLLRPDAGNVKLTGQDITQLPVHTRASMGLGYLPQEESIYRGLSVVDNIKAVLQLKNRPIHLADKFIELFGLDALQRQKAACLSAGERRRLELARLLASEPRMVLLDEPFKGLDDEAAGELTETIKSLAEKGVGLLVSEHAIHRIISICSNTYILENGNLVASGPPEDIATACPEGGQMVQGRTAWP